MKKTIGEKIYDYLNEQFRIKMPESLTEQFGDLGFKTEFNLFAGLCGAVQTGWTKKPKNTKQVKDYISAYEKGFTDAMNLVYDYKNN